MQSTPTSTAGWLFSLSLLASHAGAAEQTIAAFSNTKSDQPNAPWRVVGVPGGKIPLSSFTLSAQDAKRVLRVEANKSYGTLVHALPHSVLNSTAQLRWRWRLDKGIPNADLRQRSGDDSPLKVCASFDLPLYKLGLWERNLLRFARATSDEDLPSATLCYVWDATLPVDTLLPNAYTARVRMLVVNSGTHEMGRWVAHSRNIVADFRAAFAGEFDALPPITAVLVGGDADNTGGYSVGLVDDISLLP